MPKKKRKSKKEKEEEKDLDSLFKEIIESKRKELGENDLEEETEKTNLDLKDLDFQQFMEQTGQESSPVLERMALSGPRPLFVRGISQGQIDDNNGNGNNDHFKYIPGTGNPDEPKYIASQEGIRGTGERIEIDTAGRNQDVTPQFNQESLIEKAIESRGFSSQNFERTERVERFDAENAGRRDPFEKQDQKYEKYNPKLPKR